MKNYFDSLKKIPKRTLVLFFACLLILASGSVLAIRSQIKSQQNKQVKGESTVQAVNTAGSDKKNDGNKESPIVPTAQSNTDNKKINQVTDEESKTVDNQPTQEPNDNPTQAPENQPSPSNPQPTPTPDDSAKKEACRQVKEAELNLAKFDYQQGIDDENSRYESEVGQIDEDYNNRGLFNSGAHLAALEDAKQRHNQNLASIKSSYDSDVIKINYKYQCG